MTKKATLTLLVCVGCLFIAGCAAGINTVEDVPSPEGDIAGFWLGLWHGMIVPITWLISLFTSSVNVYEVHNNGGWYDFGFILGIGGLSSSRSCNCKSSR